MVERLFPRTRDDGGVTVAARLRLNGVGAHDLVSRQAAEWITRQTDSEHVDLLTELSSLPRIEQIDPTTVDVIFDGRPGSPLWKGLLIDLTRELTSQGSATLIGFWDLVAGHPHPASIEPHSTPTTLQK
jgi:hypothetical protein